MNPPVRCPDVTTVDDVMLRHPKTLAADASLAQVRDALSNDHVHVVLLTEGATLVGTLTRSDLPAGTDQLTMGSALPWSKLAGRTVAPDTPTSEARELLITQEGRRLAVVSADGSLLGLMCLKRRQTGFCSDADVEARVRERDEPRRVVRTSR